MFFESKPLFSSHYSLGVALLLVSLIIVSPSGLFVVFIGMVSSPLCVFNMVFMKAVPDAGLDFAQFPVPLALRPPFFVINTESFFCAFFAVVSGAIHRPTFLAGRFKAPWATLTFMKLRFRFLFFASRTLFHGWFGGKINRPKLSVPRWIKRGEGRHLPSQLWPTLILNV